MNKAFRTLRNKAREITSDTSALLPHGGQVRFNGPYPKDDEQQHADAAQIRATVEAGMRTLREGTSPFTEDVEPVGEPQIVEYFDVSTGEYVVNWLIWCKPRPSAAVN